MSALKGATAPVQFGTFIVTPQVFFQTPLSFAVVNLKPILPGHVLVCPRRVVSRVSNLTTDETSDLFLTVRRVGRMVERVYGGSSLNIAFQDGVHAGQSVPHVHAHIIPRKAADLDQRGGTDAIYDMLDGEEGDVGKAFRNSQDTAQGNLAQSNSGSSKFPVVDNEARKPRSAEEMHAEAEMLAKEMEKEPVD